MLIISKQEKVQSKIKKSNPPKGVFRFLRNKGQSIMEYALLTAAVAGAFLAMHQFIQRAAQAKLRLIEDQINQPVVIIQP